MKLSRALRIALNKRKNKSYDACVVCEEVEKRNDYNGCWGCPIEKSIREACLTDCCCGEVARMISEKDASAISFVEEMILNCEAVGD